MAESLTAYITATGDLPFIWGTRDCTLWVADWCDLHFGFDPAASIRGQYSTANGARRITGPDLTEFVAPYLAPLALKPAPMVGDIGVIFVSDRKVAAICSGAFWAIKTAEAVAFLRTDPIAIWGK